MNSKHTKILLKKYPKLFAQHKLPLTQTAMCWGFECGDGWFDLLDRLCDWLSWNIKENSHIYPQIEFTQVKEKYGTLRLYWTGIGNQGIERGLSQIDGVVNYVEYLSGFTCETCGKPGKTKEVHKWWYTVCPDCEKELKNGKR